MARDAVSASLSYSSAVSLEQEPPLQQPSPASSGLWESHGLQPAGSLVGPELPGVRPPEVRVPSWQCSGPTPELGTSPTCPWALPRPWRLRTMQTPTQMS